MNMLCLQLLANPSPVPDAAVWPFLAQAVLISLTGVMAPGPITAATLAAGTRRRHAGAVIAVGHGIVELPLMAVIAAGLGAVFQRQGFRIGVGLAGGSVLLLLGVSMALACARPAADAGQPARSANPLWTGVALTGGNPYFLLWWATVGLTMLTTAMALGPAVVLLFALLHWLCDLVWLEVLSVASFGGARIFGPRSQRVVLGVCALAMAVFGVLFIRGAIGDWVRA